MAPTARDLRLAARHLRRAPLFSAGVVLSFALGIGATVTMFSIVKGVLLRPLPFRASERLVVVQRRNPTDPSDVSPLSAADLAALRNARRNVTGVGAYTYSEFVVSGVLGAERVIGAQVTADLVDILGVRPALGRAFLAGEDGANAARIALLSYGLWQRRYGSDRAIIGRSVRLDGRPHTVVGVLPERFEFPRGGMIGRSIDLLTPLPFDPASMQGRNRRSLTAVTRLREGATLSSAQTELGLVLRSGGSGPAGTVSATPIGEHIVGKVRSPLIAMFAAVLLLLAIVCANTTNLMLSRGASRRRAASIRLALGAQRWDIVRPAVTESLVLAVCGGLLGIVASIAMRGLVLQLIPASVPRQGGIVVDVRLLAFGAVCSIVVGVVCGVLPAMRLAGESALGVLAETTRVSIGRHGRRLQRVLVVAQIGTGTVLLAATGATIVGYARLHGIAPGFDASDAVTLSVSTSGMRYRDPAARVALVDALLSRARTLPGVRSAASTNILPLGGGIMAAGYQVIGVTDTDSAAQRTAPVRSVSGGFFSTLGIPVSRGRAILDTDDATTPRVAVVNEAFARQMGGGTDPIGARMRIASPMVDSGTVAIVGVVDNVKERGLTGDAIPMIYLPARQSPFPYTNFVIRTSGAAGPVAAAMKAELARLDADLAIDEVGRLADRVRSVYALQSFGLTALVAFATLAVCLVAFGVFALVSGHVDFQKKSIGVRMALGAAPGRIQRGVLADAGRLAALGAAIGVLASFALGDVIAGLARDSTALRVDVVLAAAAGLTAVTLLAGWLPARRASRTDPRIALSSE